MDGRNTKLQKGFSPNLPEPEMKEEDAFTLCDVWMESAEPKQTAVSDKNGWMR
jgi:hypothetical protein